MPFESSLRSERKKKGQDKPAPVPIFLKAFSYVSYFEKLATASASVLYTSKMVISLVICSTT